MVESPQIVISIFRYLVEPYQVMMLYIVQVQPFQLGSTFRSLGGASPHNLRPSMPVAPRAQPSTQSDGTTTASRTLSTNPEALVNLSGLQRQAAAAMCAAAVTAALVFTPVAMAKIDNSAVGSCVLQKCQTALAQCLGDVKCVENLVCLQVCNGADDETACQVSESSIDTGSCRSCSFYYCCCLKLS